MPSSSNSSAKPPDICSFSSVLHIIFAWMVIYSLLMPLFLSVLVVGRSQRKPSHSDVFTFHIVAMEMSTTLGTYVYFFGGTYNLPRLQSTGSTLYGIGITGQMFIHALTCAERYVAVVQPITYRRLKERGGVRLRDACLAAVWLLSVGSICLRFEPHMPENYMLVSMLFAACCVILVVGFCSVSVLVVLIRPGPGEGGGDLRRLDKSKRTAFSTIIVIASMLSVRFILLIVMYLMSFVGLLDMRTSCTLSSMAGCFTFPTSVVLPLLFLRRAGTVQRACVWCRSIRKRQVKSPS